MHKQLKCKSEFGSKTRLYGFKQTYFVLAIKCYLDVHHPLYRHFQRIVYSRENMTSSTSRQPWHVNNSLTSNCLLGNDLSNLFAISCLILSLINKYDNDDSKCCLRNCKYIYLVEVQLIEAWFQLLITRSEKKWRRTSLFCAMSW